MKRARGDCRRTDCRDRLFSNLTQCSISEGKTRLFRKAGRTGAFLSTLSHCLMENSHGPEVAREMIPANGYGEQST